MPCRACIARESVCYSWGREVGVTAPFSLKIEIVVCPHQEHSVWLRSRCLNSTSLSKSSYEFSRLDAEKTQGDNEIATVASTPTGRFLYIVRSLQWSCNTTNEKKLRFSKFHLARKKQKQNENPAWTGSVQSSMHAHSTSPWSSPPSFLLSFRPLLIVIFSQVMPVNSFKSHIFTW